MNHRQIQKITVTFLIIIVTTTILILGLMQPSKATTKSETRGVWLTNVDSDILFSSAAMKQALQRLSRLNFNTIYPVVWQKGYTLYPSEVAKKTYGISVDPTPGLRNRNMLQEIIEEGHKKGLKVLPWFEYGFITPLNSKLAMEHPDWLTNRIDGTKRHQAGQAWLNPFHPEVQQFIIDLVKEVVINYDIDGIQFDDHFGLPAEFGYDDFTVSTYTKELEGLSPSENFYETFWVRWRADKLNDFVRRLSAEVKAIKPDCIISISPNPLHFSLPAYLQDWFTWERRGYIDELVIQVYRDKMNRFIPELERAEVELAKSNIPVVIGLLSGLKNRPTPINLIEEQVEEVRKHGFAGVSFFFYESLWNWDEIPPVARERAIGRLFR